MIEQSHAWLWEQRNFHWERARSLNKAERFQLQGYYDRQVLDAVRVAGVDQISNPPFYGEMAQGEFPLLDISTASGITFVDCIVIRKTLEGNFHSWISILFHELVHVTQYQILTSRRLIEEYVRAWIENGYNYHAIPFEAQAYRLEARFRRGRLPFSVRDTVERELRNML